MELTPHTRAAIAGCSVPRPARPSVVMGTVQGRVELPEHFTSHTTRMAEEFFSAAEEQSFSGDQVETYSLPLWLMRNGTNWIPDVRHLDLTRTTDLGELVATAGVDAHVDNFHRLVLLIVLHNDGLKFRQGHVSNQCAAGDWFIFDDTKIHRVLSAPGRASFIGWSIPLQELGACA